MTTQSYPIRTAEGVKLKSFELDFATIAEMRPALTGRIAHEVEAMNKGFPRWVLTVAETRAKGQQRVRCACGGTLVFMRGLRCISCDAAGPTGYDVAWFGLLPPIGIDGLRQLREPLMKRPPAQHVVGEQPAIGRYLLLPLLATYPYTYPSYAPQVFYQPEVRDIPGMPRDEVSHAFHMLPGNQMCLFAHGEWQPHLTVKDVLQQRAYAHAIKLLNYANGKHNAFASVS